ncbi:hypothetical protein DFH07DRAFT_780335 [Mycena maculata]|uniref:CHAT domain-containing protein n=1 Tax=Mycena maculata TaxID=230809 RepID=A0AAD7I4K3_9AGAR|nr:hypothetical protein DFH07DRAFT_780335 [Mycena maculata]
MVTGYKLSVTHDSCLEGFLQPDELKKAAINGSIVILSADMSSCTAFIVTLAEDVQCVDLNNMTWGIASQMAKLLRDVLRGSQAQMIQTLAEIQGREDYRNVPFTDRLPWNREGYKRCTPNQVFGWLLAELWTTVVKPIVDILGLRVEIIQQNEIRYTILTEIQEPRSIMVVSYGRVADYAVSSYTPTLTALLDPPTETASPFKMTALIQPVTPECSNLPGTEEELEKIREKVPPQWLISLGDTSPATVEIALGHLRESAITHFACHGIQDTEDPLDSGLVLSDGRLKVFDLMRGDANAKSRKRNITLAFLRFRGVAATMWTVANPDCPKIAETFYEHIFRNSDATVDPPILPGLTRAAEALHIAVSNLREDPNVSFKRWVPFVHHVLRVGSPSFGLEDPPAEIFATTGDFWSNREPTEKKMLVRLPMNRLTSNWSLVYKEVFRDLHGRWPSPGPTIPEFDSWPNRREENWRNN